MIAQRLMRKLCDRCKEHVEIESEILEGMEFPFESPRKSYTFTGRLAVGGAGRRATGAGPGSMSLW